MHCPRTRRRFLSQISASTAIEYALIAALIALALIVSLDALDIGLRTSLQHAADALS